MLKQLDRLYSGSRLEKRLASTHPRSHQDILNYLAEEGKDSEAGGYRNDRSIHLASFAGLVNRQSLNILRDTEIIHLSLCESLDTADGLNLGGRDSLKG